MIKICNALVPYKFSEFNSYYLKNCAKSHFSASQWLALLSLMRPCIVTIERFSLDCRKTKTKVSTLANQRA